MVYCLLDIIGLDSSSIQYNGGTNPSDIRLGEFSSVEDTVQKFGRMKRQSPTDQQVNITRDITVRAADAMCTLVTYACMYTLVMGICL